MTRSRLIRTAEEAHRLMASFVRVEDPRSWVDEDDEDDVIPSVTKTAETQGCGEEAFRVDL